MTTTKTTDSPDDGPCRRLDSEGEIGLVICTPLMMALSNTSVGIQDFTAVTFATGKMVRYVGVRRSRKEKVLLFNVCPFCRFEFAMKPADAAEAKS